MMRPPLRLHIALFAVLLTVVVPAVALRAQAQPAQPSPMAHLTFATRMQIDSMARAAEASAGSSASPAERDARAAEAVMLRQRLAQGDFSVGDRIIVRVEGQLALSDTFTVREGLRLQLPGIADVPLTGVLRSEAEARVMDAVAAYYRDPSVRVVPLLRVLVRGGVVHAGYYALPADQLLSDAIMAAGGPNALAKLGSSELKRGDKKIYNAKEFARLVQEGASLDQAHLRPGDEIVVGEKGHQNWAAIFQGIGAVMGIITLVYTFGNR